MPYLTSNDSLGLLIVTRRSAGDSTRSLVGAEGKSVHVVLKLYVCGRLRLATLEGVGAFACAKRSAHVRSTHSHGIVLYIACKSKVVKGWRAHECSLLPIPLSFDT